MVPPSDTFYGPSGIKLSMSYTTCKQNGLLSLNDKLKRWEPGKEKKKKGFSGIFN